MAQNLPDETFRWIVDAMPEAVVYSDREGIIRLWNRGAETIFGYRREDARAQTLDLIVPERWRARHWEGYRTVMRTGVTRYGRSGVRPCRAGQLGQHAPGDAARARRGSPRRRCAARHGRRTPR